MPDNTPQGHMMLEFKHEDLSHISGPRIYLYLLCLMFEVIPELENSSLQI